MSTMTPSYGASWVRTACDMKPPPMLTLTRTDHARLKDHVSGMPGQLSAAVHEGGMCPGLADDLRIADRVGTNLN